MSVPLVSPNGGVGLTAAPGFETDASAKVIKGASPDAVITRLTFSNPLAERRIAALEGTPKGTMDGARALVFDGRLALQQGSPPSVVAVFFESDGGVWYRISGKTMSGTEFGEIRLPLSGTFTRARFATDADEAIRWEQVERVWLGLLVNGPASGVFELRHPRFTDALFRPISAVRLGPTWDVAQDPAVQSKLDPAVTEPDGSTSMEYRFNLPGGRHMFALPRTPVNVEELDGYSALQFTYRADLPPGIDGLLVMLIEADGTQYRAVPPPPASSEWRTATIPFQRFERGSWSKDENDRLNLGDVSQVAIGMHGTTPAAASGAIKVRDVQFLP